MYSKLNNVYSATNLQILCDMHEGYCMYVHCDRCDVMGIPTYVHMYIIFPGLDIEYVFMFIR